MKSAFGTLIAAALVPLAHAADLGAGKARAAAVCAACHGANGISVSDTIPNLAVQTAREGRALPDGSVLFAAVEMRNGLPAERLCFALRACARWVLGS